MTSKGALRLVLLVCAALLIGFPPARAQDEARAVIFPQLGHASIVASVAFSPDGRLLASGGDGFPDTDHTVRLWDLASGRELRTLKGHTATVNAVAFSPDGKILASGSDDDTVRLWDLATGRALRALTAGVDRVESLAFSPDGKLLVWAGAGIHLWDVPDAREARVLKGSGPAVFSPDGKTLASGGDANTITLWDAETGRLLRTLAGPATAQGGKIAVKRIAFSPDGIWLATSDGSITSELWSVAGGSAPRVLASDRLDFESAAAFSPDGKVIATASDFISPGSGSSVETIKLWDPGSARELRAIAVSAAAASVTFSPDGRALAWAGRDDRAIRLLNVSDGRQTRILGGNAGAVTAVAISPDGDMFASGSSDSTVKLWSSVDGRELRTLTGPKHQIDSVAFSPDAALLAASAQDNSIWVWDVASGRPVRTIKGQDDAVYSVAFSPDGKTLGWATNTHAMGAGDHLVLLLDLTSQGEPRALAGHTAEVSAVAFSPDRRLLASGGYDGTVRLWDAASGRPVSSVTVRDSDAPSEPAQIDSVLFSSGGKVLAAIIGGGTIKLWSMPSGHELPAPKRHWSTIESAIFSPDGKALILSTDGTGITRWDLVSGRELPGLNGNIAGLGALAVSPDGATIISGGDDGVTRVWNVPSGKERLALIGFNDGLSIAVTPQGFFDSSSAAAEEHLNVRIGDRVFGISSFRDTFYRPDLVRRSLAGEDISRFGDIANVKLSPVVELVNTPASTGASTFEVQVRLSEGGGGIGPVRVFKQGTVILQDDSQGQLTRRYTIPLSSGDNAVRVAAANADGSMWSMVDGTVTSTLPAANDNAPRGTLHAIVIGINNFPSLGADLTLAVGDANLFANTLRDKAKPLFKSLDIQPMVTSDVTDRQHIIDAIRAMQKTVGPNDAFVFYVASHGIVADGEYYLVTSNVGAVTVAALKQNGISRRELTDLLANIGTTHKVVFIDTCDAGGLGDAGQQAISLAGMDPKTAATIIGRQVGMTMLMAADTEQEALAGYPPTAAANDQHGLFTYALNQGLQGEAADPTTGLVASDKLANYVNKTVPSIAKSLNRAQQPTDVPAGQPFPLTKAN